MTIKLPVIFQPPPWHIEPGPLEQILHNLQAEAAAFEFIAMSLFWALVWSQVVRKMAPYLDARFPIAWPKKISQS